MHIASMPKLYRIFHPTKRQFTFYSARHKSYSRLDYILISHASYSKIQSVDIKTCPLSDHSVVSAKISLVSAPTKVSCWRFNTTLQQNKDFCAMLKEELSWFIEVNAGSVDDPHFVWDAIKCCIQSSYIS